MRVKKRSEKKVAINLKGFHLFWTIEHCIHSNCFVDKLDCDSISGVGCHKRIIEFLGLG